ncbi:MAG: AAA family ATPase [Pelagibaca sp.]
MPKSSNKTPVWSGYADIMIARLCRHHGVPTTRFAGTAEAEDEDEPSELDELFARFEPSQEGESFDAFAKKPSRHVPARQLLTALRLAITFGSMEIEQQSLQCGALTVVRDVPVEELATLKETVKACSPRSEWQIIAPETVDGGLVKSAQDRFDRAISDSLDRIDPVLILQTDGIRLPRSLGCLTPPTLRFAEFGKDILAAFLQAGHLSDQISDRKVLLASLPENAVLAKLSTTEVCAALRAPTLDAALFNLRTLTNGEQYTTGPRLDDMTGDSPSLEAARRIVNDLLAWKAGRAGWHEINRSLLLYGPPGTGKTWLARAMGNSAGVATISSSFAEWQAAGHLGDMLREMRASFSEARRRAPCLLIIDEIDAVGSRNDQDRHATQYRMQVINGFLGELDAISREEGVMVVGTCNHPERMDPAVMRAGRMDIKIKVPLPNAGAILAILRHHLREDIADHELRALAPRAVGRSAAELDAAIRAARSNARHSRKMLDLAMLLETLNIGPDHDISEILWRVAVHESGHAIVGAALRLGNIDNIQISGNGGSIMREGMAHQGLLADFEAEITYAMAGRAAEHLVLGLVSAGAGGPPESDLAKATRKAIDIETTFGLGFNGPVWRESTDLEHLKTPAIMDRVRHRLEKSEKRAVSILKANRVVLEALARELVSKRSMRPNEIAPFLSQVKARETGNNSSMEHDELAT